MHAELAQHPDAAMKKPCSPSAARQRKKRALIRRDRSLNRGEIRNAPVRPSKADSLGLSYEQKMYNPLRQGAEKEERSNTLLNNRGKKETRSGKKPHTD